MSAGKISNRQIRKSLNAQGQALEQTVMPTLSEAMKVMQGLSENQVILHNALQAHVGKRFVGRLRWLVMGR